MPRKSLVLKQYNNEQIGGGLRSYNNTTTSAAVFHNKNHNKDKRVTTYQRNNSNLNQYNMLASNKSGGTGKYVVDINKVKLK